MPDASWHLPLASSVYDFNFGDEVSVALAADVANAMAATAAISKREMVIWRSPLERVTLAAIDDNEKPAHLTRPKNRDQDETFPRGQSKGL